VVPEPICLSVPFLSSVPFRGLVKHGSPGRRLSGRLPFRAFPILGALPGVLWSTARPVDQFWNSNKFSFSLFFWDSNKLDSNKYLPRVK
jgi:hypothetical protein